MVCTEVCRSPGATDHTLRYGASLWPASSALAWPSGFLFWMPTCCPVGTRAGAPGGCGPGCGFVEATRCSTVWLRASVCAGNRERAELAAPLFRLRPGWVERLRDPTTTAQDPRCWVSRIARADGRKSRNERSTQPTKPNLTGPELLLKLLAFQAAHPAP